jgi:hypothetical protein
MSAIPPTPLKSPLVQGGTDSSRLGDLFTVSGVKPGEGFTAMSAGQVAPSGPLQGHPPPPSEAVHNACKPLSFKAGNSCTRIDPKAVDRIVYNLPFQGGIPLL